MTPHRAHSRSICALLAAGLLIASCSSDSKSSDTTAAGTQPASSAPSDALTGDGLTLGLLVPPAGLLSTFFEAQIHGVDEAVADVNDGGGVLGGPLKITQTPVPLDQTPASVVPAALADASSLIGPAGSTGAKEVRTALTDANATGCSASASVPSLTEGQTKLGLFRTIIPDDVLTSYLADQITAKRDAKAPGQTWKIAIVAREDDYGFSVGNSLAVSLQSRGFAPTVIGYNPRRVNFTGTAAEVTKTSPDLTVIVSYEEGAQIVTELLRGGLSASSMIGLDSFFRPRLGTLAGPDGDASKVDGLNIVGTIGNLAWINRMTTAYPNGQIANSAQAYDCAITFALATAAVEKGTSADLSTAVRDVTGGGTTCTTYADCLDKLNAGEDINYDGVSGQLAIDEQGDPTFARFTTATVVNGEIGDPKTSDVDIAQIRKEEAAFAAASFNTQLQLALTTLGFYTGPIDGLSSPELTNALKAFQVSVGLPPTGIYDAATDAALRAALGDNSLPLTASTLELQVLLRDLGYYNGPIDGIWNAQLTEAVRALQRDLGVPETGFMDAATITAIYQQGITTGTATTTTVAGPATTAAPTTAAPTTAPPVTPPPTTAPPVTPPPTTAPPVTPPPTTAPPVPPPTLTVFQTLQADPDFSKVVELLIASGYTGDLGNPIPITFFAPTNEAFAGVTDAQFEALKSDPATLLALLGYHVTEGKFLQAALPANIDTVNGASLPVVRNPDGSVIVGGAPITRPDILATNGVIQGLGKLLTLPASATPLPAPGP